MNTLTGFKSIISNKVSICTGTHYRRRIGSRICAAAVAEQSAVLDITKMAPLGDRVMLKPFEVETKTESGLLLPGTASVGSMDQAVFAEVIAVGDEVKLKIKAGDSVIFSKYGTADVEVSDGKVILAYEKSIMATLQ